MTALPDHLVLPKYSIILPGCRNCLCQGCPARVAPARVAPAAFPPSHGSGWKNRHGACPTFSYGLEGLPCQGCPRQGCPRQGCPARVALPVAPKVPLGSLSTALARVTGLPPPGLPTRSASPGLPRQGCPCEGCPCQGFPRLPLQGCPRHQPRHHVAYLCTFSVTALSDNLVLLARLHGFVVLLYEGTNHKLPAKVLYYSARVPAMLPSPGLHARVAPATAAPAAFPLIRVIPESCDQHGSGWKNRHGACPGLAMALRVSQTQ